MTVQTDEGTIICVVSVLPQDIDTATGRAWLMDELVREFKDCKRTERVEKDAARTRAREALR
jgi:hypothetical protein